MVRRSTILVAACIVCVLAAALPSHAQMTSDQRTYFSFNVPVALPGVTLPPGKYLFRVADTFNRNVIQIFNADGTILYKTLIAISAQRLEPTGEPEVRFMEAPANLAPPIKTWWYPGTTFGHEFIYPQEQARRIAEAAEQPVLTTQQAVPIEEMKSAELARVGPTGQEMPVETAPEAPQGRVQPGTPAPEAMILPAQEEKPVATSGTKAAHELPKTFSLLPLIGLAGLLALGASIALVVARVQHR